MELSICSNVVSADVLGSLKQMEETFGARVRALSCEHPPFQKMGALHISPDALHPLLGERGAKRGSFHAASNAYYISPVLNYVEFASADWTLRVAAYAKAVEEAVSRVPQTRLTAQERELLLGIVRQARADVAQRSPQHVTMVEPVYVKTEDATGPLFSYTPQPGMTRVALEDIPNNQPLHADQEESLFKLYKKIEGVTHYREAWLPDDRTVVEHQGRCGDRGETREHRFDTAAAARDNYFHLKRIARDDGFRTISNSKHAKLVVEFAINGMGSHGDLQRRHALEEFLDDLIGWLGLGHLDGGSSGSGTMEATCYVVDFEIAKAAVEQALRASSFSDFRRVYREK